MEKWNKLQETAAKSLVIPRAGEEANESLREFYVKRIQRGQLEKRLTSDNPVRAPIITKQAPLPSPAYGYIATL